jgi:hypothetical protein
MYGAECLGTFLLVVLGLSLVIALWGKGAPLAWLPLAPGQRRLLNGFLFGCVGAAVAYSPIGRISGAHINPAMTFAFWLEGKLQWRDATCYVLAQLCGAAAGGVLLLAWGRVGASDAWGAARHAWRNRLHLPVGHPHLRLRRAKNHTEIHPPGQPASVRRPDLAGSTLIRRQRQPGPQFRARTGGLGLDRLVGVLGRPARRRRVGGRGAA